MIVDFNCIKINLFIVGAEYDVRYADIVYFTFKGDCIVRDFFVLDFSDFRSLVPTCETK